MYKAHIHSNVNGRVYTASEEFTSVRTAFKHLKSIQYIDLTSSKGSRFEAVIKKGNKVVLKRRLNHLY